MVNAGIQFMVGLVNLYSETCLNCPLDKLKYCLNQTQIEVLLYQIHLNLGKPYSCLNQIVQSWRGLDRF